MHDSPPHPHPHPHPRQGLIAWSNAGASAACAAPLRQWPTCTGRFSKPLIRASSAATSRSLAPSCTFQCLSVASCCQAAKERLSRPRWSTADSCTGTGGGGWGGGRQDAWPVCHHTKYIVPRSQHPQRLANALEGWPASGPSTTAARQLPLASCPGLHMAAPAKHDALLLGGLLAAGKEAAFLLAQAEKRCEASKLP
jgi:hypothetical protein